MENAFKIKTFLPIHFDKEHQEYVDMLWEGFETNYKGESYLFAFFAIHLLYMVSLFSMLKKYKQINPNMFDLALIGTEKNRRNEIKKNKSTFVMSEISEALVIDYLKLLEFSDGQIGDFKSSLSIRNVFAHPKGIIPIKNKYDIDSEIKKVLSHLNKIHFKCDKIIFTLLLDLLKNNWDKDDFRHDNYPDEIREFILPEYEFSIKDMEIINNYDISNLKSEAKYNEIRELYKNLKGFYPFEITNINLWTEIECLVGDSLKTLSQNKEFKIINVDDKNIIVYLESTKKIRKINKLKFENSANYLFSNGSMTRTRIRDKFSIANPAYVAGILAKISNVEFESKPIIKLFYRG